MEERQRLVFFFPACLRPVNKLLRRHLDFPAAEFSRNFVASSSLVFYSVNVSDSQLSVSSPALTLSMYLILQFVSIVCTPLSLHLSFTLSMCLSLFFVSIVCLPSSLHFSFTLQMCLSLLFVSIVCLPLSLHLSSTLSMCLSLLFVSIICIPLSLH